MMDFNTLLRPMSIGTGFWAQTLTGNRAENESWSNHRTSWMPDTAISDDLVSASPVHCNA